MRIAYVVMVKKDDSVVGDVFHTILCVFVLLFNVVAALSALYQCHGGILAIKLPQGGLYNLDFSIEHCLK